MKRIAVSCAFAAGALLGIQGPVQAQGAYLFGGGGASIPVGSFKNDDHAKTGWMTQGGVGVEVGKTGLWVEAEGWYGSNKHKAPDAGSKTNLAAGFAALGYSIGPSATKVHPYVVGGAGFLNHKFVPATGSSESTTKFAYTGGAGLTFTLTRQVDLWFEGRVMGTTKRSATETRTTTLPLSGGLTLHVGKS